MSKRDHASSPSEHAVAPKAPKASWDSSGRGWCHIKGLVADLRNEFQEPDFRPLRVSQLLESFQFVADDWKAYSHFDSYRYSRNLLAADEHFSLILLCWCPGQSTPIHVHHRERECCWVKCLEGSLVYTQFDQLPVAGQACSALSSRTIDADGPPMHSSSSMGIHQMRNASCGRSLSLHLYSPPFLECCFSTADGSSRAVPVIFCPVAGDPHALHPRPRMRLQMANPRCNRMYTNFKTLADILIHELNKPAEWDESRIEHMRTLLASLRFNPREFQQYANVVEGKYTRNLIGYADKFTLLLLCWDNLQESPVHDHAGSACFMKILQGSMEEWRYDASDPSNLNVSGITPLNVDDVAYIDDSLGVHKMVNPSASEVAFSLHIYIPPYESCHIFNLQEKTRVKCSMEQLAVSSTGLEVNERAYRADALTDANQIVRLIANAFSRRDTFASADDFNAHVASILDCVEFEVGKWSELVHFSTFSYVRILISDCPQFSLLLACWNGGQKTPLHTHGPEVGRTSWTRVLQGRVEYRKWEDVRPVDKRASSCKLHYCPNDDHMIPKDVVSVSPQSGTYVCSDAALGIHQTANPDAQGTALSLHLFSPPYIECTYHDHDACSRSMPVVYCSKSMDDGTIANYRSRIDVNSSLQCLSSSQPQRSFTSMQFFVETLSRALADQPSDCTRIVEQLLLSSEFHPQELETYMVFDKCHFTQRLVASHERFSVHITCWYPNQQSPIHDHGESTCWSKVLRGRCRVTRYDESPWGARGPCEEAEEGDVLVASTGQPSRMVNTNDRESVVLHVICPPYRSCRCFDETSGESCVVEAERLPTHCHDAPKTSS